MQRRKGTLPLILYGLSHRFSRYHTVPHTDMHGATNEKVSRRLVSCPGLPMQEPGQRKVFDFGELVFKYAMGGDNPIIIKLPGTVLLLLPFVQHEYTLNSPSIWWSFIQWYKTTINPLSASLSVNYSISLTSFLFISFLTMYICLFFHSNLEVLTYSHPPAAEAHSSWTSGERVEADNWVASTSYNTHTVDEARIEAYQKKNFGSFYKDPLPHGLKEDDINQAMLGKLFNMESMTWHYSK